MTSNEPNAEPAHIAGILDAPSSARSLGLRWWIVLGIGATLAAVLLSIAAHRVPFFAYDVVLTRALQAAPIGALAVPMQVLNALGFPPLVDFVYGGVLVALLVVGRRWEAAAGGFDALGSAGINHLCKALVDRPRPSTGLVHVEHHIANPTFPAGHVLNFTAFAGFLCFLAYLLMKRGWLRGTVISTLLVLIVLMGVARVSSGEHWTSDVLGGYLLGLGWLAVTVLVYAGGRARFRVQPSRPAPARGRHALLAALLALSPAVLAEPAGAQTDAVDSLATSSAVPWNPPHAMSRRRGWEQAVLLPGRVVSLPLSALGYATDALLFHIEQSPRFGPGAASPLGAGGGWIALHTPRMGDRVGLGGAVEVRHEILHGALASTLGAEYTATLLRYNQTLVTWSGNPAALQYGYVWRPQDRFYGIGNDAPVDSVSDYASQSEFVRGGLRWGTVAGHDHHRPHTEFALWGGPRSQVTRDGRESGEVTFATRFPALATSTLDRRVENLVYGASLQHDALTGSPHWYKGWRGLASAERFDAPVRALALHSGAGDGAQFTRYKFEAETGFSFMRDPRTFRFLVRATDMQVGANRDRLLVSDLSTLGGHEGLGGYSPGRFHDLDLLLTRLDYVFPLQRSLEFDLHSEWGAVFPDLWSDAKLAALHNSYGFALRLRSDRAPLASIGFDFSREAVRLRFSLGGVQ